MWCIIAAPFRLTMSSALNERRLKWIFWRLAKCCISRLFNFFNIYFLSSEWLGINAEFLWFFVFQFTMWIFFGWTDALSDSKNTVTARINWELYKIQGVSHLMINHQFRYLQLISFVWFQYNLVQSPYQHLM